MPFIQDNLSLGTFFGWGGGGMCVLVCGVPDLSMVILYDIARNLIGHER